MAGPAHWAERYWAETYWAENYWVEGVVVEEAPPPPGRRIIVRRRVVRARGHLVAAPATLSAFAWVRRVHRMLADLVAPLARVQATGHRRVRAVARLLAAPPILRARAIVDPVPQDNRDLLELEDAGVL